MKAKYPECEKLAAVREQSQAIGEFLDWLTGKKGVVLAKPHNHGESGCEEGERRGVYTCGLRREELFPVGRTIQSWLKEFFEIDGEELEAERRQMLANLRKGAK